MRDIISAIPSTWDESRALPSSVLGESVVVARRKGDVWYLAGTSTSAMTLTPSLEFIGSEIDNIKLYQDSSDASQVELCNCYKVGDPINLLENGGFVMQITLAK